MTLVDKRQLDAPEGMPGLWAAQRVARMLQAGGALIVALAVGAWALASLALALAPAPLCVVGQKEDVACARGFEARERDDTSERTYRWTDGAAGLLLAGAGYGSPRAVAIELAAARPPGSPLPRVALSVGGTAVAIVAPVPPRRYMLLLPPGFPSGDVARLALSSDTMTTTDGRDLGVVVYEAQLLRLGGLTLAGPLLSLALLALGLSGALVCTPSRPTSAGRWLPALAGLGWMLVALVLWLWHPQRIAPLLPQGAALVGISALALRRLWLWERPASPVRPTIATGVLLGVIAGVCLANGLSDWVIMEGVAKRREIPWAVLAQTLVTLAACWWLGRVARAGGFSLTLVLATALAVRMLALTVRVLTGRVPNDADTELFYNYGRATIELGVPEVEYPSGALVVWAALALPGSRELFLLFVPLLNLICDLVVAWGIWRIGAIAQTRGRAVGIGMNADAYEAPTLVRADPSSAAPTGMVVGSYLALCYALSPLLLPFWHAKFDPVPAALMVLALLAYAAERPWWVGVALGVGGTVKWAPWVSVPFPGWAWLRAGRPGWRALVLYVVGVAVSVLALLLPFALYDWHMFLQPYRTQGNRQFIGESIWYPIALIFEPELQARRAPPYAGLPSAYLSNGLLVGVQLGALALLGLIQVLRPLSWRRTLVLTALAPAIFFLLNRVFSPQYLLIIVACLYAAAAVVFSLRQMVVLALLVTLMEAANLLVWPYTQSYWLRPSIINLGIGVGIAMWLAVVACRLSASESG